MDQLRQSRGRVRASITRTITEVEAELSKNAPDLLVLRAKSQKLEEWQSRVAELDHNVLRAMQEATCSDEDYNKEGEVCEEYEDKIRLVQLKITDLLSTPLQLPLLRPISPDNSSQWYNSVASSGGERRRQFKLPKINLRKFNGELKDWLSWWSQFVKIHEDDTLHTSDKFEYLVQCMVVGSRARDLVDVYPHTEDNYPKVIAALHERFGKPKLLKQWYVRELLKMVIQNVKQKEEFMLPKLFDKLESHLKALESLGVSSEQMAEFLFPMVESSLPEDILKAWQRSNYYGMDGSREIPPKSELDYLLKFLRQEVEAEGQRAMARNGFESNENSKKDVCAKPKNKKHESDVPTLAELHINESKKSKSCIFCAKPHESKECGFARNMTHEEKQKKVIENHACFRCLKPGHSSRKCKAFVKCIICQHDLQSIMCPSLSNVKKESKPKEAEDEEQERVNVGTICAKGMLFETLSVRLVGKDGKHHTARVFLDRGSARSFIKESTSKLLGYKPVGEDIFGKEFLEGPGSGSRKHNLYDVTVTNLKGNFMKCVQLTGLKTMSCKIPRIPNGPWIEEIKSKKINLSDFNYSNSDEIDILIGGDKIPGLLTGKQIILQCGMVATETHFGWALLGPLDQNQIKPIFNTVLCSHLNDITNYWDLDVLSIRDPIEVKTEAAAAEEAKKLFAQNIGKEPDGRYVVSLPWAEGKEELPDNKWVAEKRLQNVTNSLMSKGKYEEYDKVFRSWEEEGIIEVCANTDVSKCHYLPHRPVFKESATTPVRPVFDASCKVGKHPSLNDCLYKGPNMIELIPSVLMKFREKRIGVMSDIRKAFQMISICAKDRDFQRFMWWNDRKQLKVYRHTRVVFGVSSSPFLLAATLKYHLENVEVEMKGFAQNLLQSLYVDNCLTSVDNYGEYERFKSQATRLMNEAKMDLRQWECSTVEVSGIGSLTSRECGLDNGSTTSANVLGLSWDKKTDTLSCSIPEKPEKMTKRAVLSQVHRIFDPIGFTCPALLLPKLILQKTWDLKIDWDEYLPDDLMKMFQKWVEEVPKLLLIQIPRHAFGGRICTNQLHLFVDASQDAFAAVVFVRSEDEDGIKVQLIEAKNRVTPIKKPAPTIPRLELLSCLIGSRILKRVIETLEPKECRIFCWTDSSTALAWIRRRENWGTFVGRRVKEIASNTDVDTWRHIPGVLNPADLPSRGCSPKELLMSRWWEGPKWLKSKLEDGPCSEPVFDEKEIGLERKKITVPVSVFKERSVPEPHFSTFAQNLRVYGWIRRFFNNCRAKKNERISAPHLSLAELRSAQNDLVRLIQQQSIPENTDTICNIQLRKDEDGIYRVMTRIVNKEETESFKNPAFLPSYHPLDIKW